MSSGAMRAAAAMLHCLHCLDGSADGRWVEGSDRFSTERFVILEAHTTSFFFSGPFEVIRSILPAYLSAALILPAKSLV